MKRKIITTSDGSKTIQIEDWNEQYHSIHGAINEANHVFIKHGLLFFNEHNTDVSPISILEIGFGTGLNALLTFLKGEDLKLAIDYVGVEAYPVSEAEVGALNYTDLVSKDHESLFKNMHASDWNIPHALSPNFNLEKQQKYFKDIKDQSAFDIIYFDAFGARVQPELWTEAIFKIMIKALKPKGVLVTYAAKGSVRRAMQVVGFEVERLPGPPGKREMLRAIKP